MSTGVIIAQSLGLIIFYGITGVGFGAVVGMLIGSQLGAHGKETMAQGHEHNRQKASEYNAQWNPKHQRWQK